MHSPPPTMPMKNHLPFTDKEFRHAHVPSYRFFGNVAYEQELAIKERIDAYVGILIHGGGQRFIESFPEKVEELAQFVRSIRFKENGEVEPEVTVIAPEIKNKKANNRFGQPFTYYVLLGQHTDLLRAYLLWQEVFAIHPTLSFSIHPLDNPEQPWTVMTLTGPPGAVVDSVEAKQMVMGNIKRAVWGNKDYRFFVISQYQKQGYFGDMAELVKSSTDSLDMTVVEIDETGPNRGKLAYVVFCKPISHDRQVYADWVGFYTAPGYYRRNVYRLDVEKRQLDCKLCKDTSHSALSCPLPLTEGWQGPTLEEIYPQKKAGAKAGQSASIAPSKQAEHAWKEVPRKGKGPKRTGGPQASGGGGPKKGTPQRTRR